MRGESVILDASWIDARWRNAAQEVSSRTRSDLVELCCLAAAEVADTRIVHRLIQDSDISEATPEVRMAMARAMDPWPSSIVIDTSDSTAEESIAQVLKVLAKGQESDS
jgi:hypothetical protein